MGSVAPTDHLKTWPEPIGWPALLELSGKHGSESACAGRLSAKVNLPVLSCSFEIRDGWRAEPA